MDAEHQKFILTKIFVFRHFQKYLFISLEEQVTNLKATRLYIHQWQYL